MTNNNTDRNSTRTGETCDEGTGLTTEFAEHQATTSYIVRDRNLKIRTRTCKRNKHLLVRINKRTEDALTVTKRIVERSEYDTVYVVMKYGRIKRMDRSALRMVYDMMGYEVYVGYVPRRIIRENEYVCLYRMERIRSV